MKINYDPSRVHMDALTASDDLHRKAMRGATPEIAAAMLKDCYNLTDEQAEKAQHLRDVDGVSEDDVIKLVRTTL